MIGPWSRLIVPHYGAPRDRADNTGRDPGRRTANTLTVAQRTCSFWSSYSLNVPIYDRSVIVYANKERTN